MAILDKYLVGWNDLEPVIVGCVSCGHNLMFLGKHGCGKSSLARFLSNAFGDSEKFTIYHCDKENLISAVGIPDAEALKKGRVSYATHDRSVFNADVILLDELPRAPKDGQNMWLEILEEKTIFGIPLRYKYLIATGNDETYKANYRLDAALLDRFYAVIPTPTTSTAQGNSTEAHSLSAEEIREMIELNYGKRDELREEANSELMNLIHKVRKSYIELWRNRDIRANVINFASKFFASVLQDMAELNKGAKDVIYIPPRVIGHQFVRVLLAVSAYWKEMGREDYLELGARDAIQYNLATKLAIPVDKLFAKFNDLRDLLTDSNNRLNQIRVELTTGSAKNRIAVLTRHTDVVAEQFEPAEQVAIVGSLTQIVEDEKEDKQKNLANLYSALDGGKINDVCINSVECAILRDTLISGVFANTFAW